MIGALFTGISGLSSQQKALDNEANNIANVNTVGYKASRISFADQMYQDRVGKGSKVLDAEKLYSQGNLKLTGVAYDMALSGEGFFTVKSSSSNENLYTRAGNFRMGDNGTLQDAAGNEVQGWMMVSIDTAKDVTSTNPNVDVFTNDYNKLLASKVVRHSTYVETITAKATDYTATATSDSETVFSGAGMKTKSAKISDIEEAIKDYTMWLQRLSEEPDGASSTSISQISEINFKTGDAGLVTKEGDQIYAFIDGTKISQNYVATTASDEFIGSMFELNTTGTAPLEKNLISSAANGTVTIGTVANNSRYSVTIDGIEVHYDSDTDATEEEILGGLKAAILAKPSIGLSESEIDITSTANTLSFLPANAAGAGVTEVASYSSIIEESYDVAASRIATYKALADKISEIPGLKASMVEEQNASQLDAFDEQDTYNPSTYNRHMYYGQMQIKSLIPGKEFVISEVAEVSGNTVVQGNYQTSTGASAGSGIGALNSSKDALSRLITGNQRDVYTSADLSLDGNVLQNFTYGITIYDKEIGSNIPIPNDGATPPQQLFVSFTGKTIDEVVDAINNVATATVDPDGTAASVPNTLLDYVIAKNVNGSLVIETKDDNYDVEFSGVMKQSVPVQPQIAATSYTLSQATNDTSYTITNSAGTFTYTSDADATLEEIIDGLAALDTSLTASDTNNDGKNDTITSSTTIIAAQALNTNGEITAQPIDVNNNFSGRTGAGAEFIELINTVDQTASKGSLQLRLDTLGISESAFGEFSVDSTGLITMKQDGADFAIGQVAIALFNNNRGLDPVGDNLVAKTTTSGEPFYNLDNNKTAKIEGKTLELSSADLSESLVNLMVFQRAFEANAKSITTSDELLNTLINLKR